MKQINFKKTILILPLILLFISGCKPSCNQDKLPDYDILNEEAFFEFCIPYSAELAGEVRTIVPNADFLEESSGLIDCDPEKEILVLIDLDTPEKAMCELTNLDYVEKIAVSVGE